MSTWPRAGQVGKRSAATHELHILFSQKDLWFLLMETFNFGYGGDIIMSLGSTFK